MKAQQHTLTNKHCLIIGLGQTGLSCARFLSAKAMSVAIMDTRPEPPEKAMVEKRYPQVLIKTGELDLDWLLQADLIVLSPGVDPRMPEIKAAYAQGIEIIGDIELFARYADAPIVAITGSNGKSTVTMLVGLMAQLAGKEARTGGNLGTPALDLISDVAPDFYILELSSFQLETVRSLNALAAVVLNISADHMDRYETLAEYEDAKRTIYNGDGVMVINRDDPAVMGMQRSERVQISFGLDAANDTNFGVLTQQGELWLAMGATPLIAAKELNIMGRHNVANALAALALGAAMALPMEVMTSALQAFRGLPHRCHLVRELNQVQWFNDSKATNVGASAAAIEGLAGRGNIILIAGGIGKDQNFSALTPFLRKGVTAVILLGRDAQQIARIIPSDIKQYEVKTMQEAVETAAAIALPGETVLLSPACASFDMFSGYAERGNVFEAAVMELAS